ncbi:MAG: L-2-hydroxyglutarate oxidase [Candidatus Omnitrophica bacterium]|nr:L-2-hydroxyglutarate oxidase [Candidatus Omnitrophota bacterium]
MTTPYDVAIIGGGIVGLATAYELTRRSPSRRIILLEKEPTLGAHQTTHNSGVIHSGVSYRPGSLKAKTCVEGAKLLVRFCQSQGIPHRLCGKLIVATEPAEVPALDALHARGLANGVPGLTLIGAEALRGIEPHARGVRALHIPGAGIVDYGAVARRLGELIRARGVIVQTSSRVHRLARREQSWLIETTNGAVHAGSLVNCAGLHVDRLAMLAGAVPALQIVPFRGDYYDVIPERRHLVNALIYPVPNPRFPFLGVHFTRSIDGRVHAGPNAVLALKREGYRKTDFSLSDTLSLVGHRGVWRMARAHWRMGLSELHRSLSKSTFVRALQRLVPEIRAGDLVPAEAGVRAQAVDDSGFLLDDFKIVQQDHAIHVLNAPSPAATASLRIGQLIADFVA